MHTHRLSLSPLKEDAFLVILASRPFVFFFDSMRIQVARSKQTAFTLTELMVVMVIIGILAGVVTITTRKILFDTRRAAIEENLMLMRSMGAVYMVDNPSVTSVTYQMLIDDDYVKPFEQVVDENYSTMLIRKRLPGNRVILERVGAFSYNQDIYDTFNNDGESLQKINAKGF